MIIVHTQKVLNIYQELEALKFPNLRAILSGNNPLEHHGPIPDYDSPDRSERQEGAQPPLGCVRIVAPRRLQSAAFYGIMSEHSWTGRSNAIAVHCAGYHLFLAAGPGVPHRASCIGER